jgi:hypothetical protein
MRQMITSPSPNGSTPQMEISRHYLFRMGIIVWKPAVSPNFEVSPLNDRQRLLAIW